MNFRITGLDSAPFQHLFGLPDDALAAAGAKRYQVDSHPGYPDRITMQDALPGASVLLVNHVSQPAKTPYYASHAIFVLEGADTPYDAINIVPEVMQCRLLSLRGFSDDGMLIDADVVKGHHIRGVIERLFADPSIAYIHVHNAKQGCYSGRIDRA